jgi:hypothetical protein
MQTTYAFALGDQVDLARAIHNTFRGPYEITAILPENPMGEPQYALRSESGHERVVTEAEILPAAAPAAAKPSPEEVKAKREADRKEREEQANSAWKDYLDERDHVARRTAELRELRLKAEAEAAEKIARLAREAAANKAKAGGAKALSKANGVKPAEPKGKAETKPAVKGKAEVKAPAKQAAKPKAELKPAAKQPVKAPAKPVAKAKPAVKGKAKTPAKAPVKAAAKAARPKAASVTRAAKPKAKAKARG